MDRFSLVRAILTKDLLDFLKNRTLIITIAAPIFLSLLFRFALGSVDKQVLKLAVVNSSDSKIVEFMEKKTLGFVDAQPVATVSDAKELVSEGTVHGALVLPDNFDEKVKSGKSPKVVFWVDMNNFTQASALESLVTKMLYYYRGDKPPAQIIVQNVRDTGFRPDASMLSAWLLFTALGAFMVVSSSIVEEKEKKTLQAVLATPCRLPDIVAGKVLLGFTLSFSAALIILGLNDGFIGSWPATLVIIALGCLAFSVTGVLIGLALSGHTTVNAFGSLLYIGLLLPVMMSEVSKKVEAFAKYLPSYYVYDGINKAMYAEAGFADLKLHIIYLAAVGIVIFLSGVYILRKKENLD